MSDAQEGSGPKPREVVQLQPQAGSTTFDFGIVVDSPPDNGSGTADVRIQLLVPSKGRSTEEAWWTAVLQQVSAKRPRGE
jgi:hypothetical protein